MAEVGAEGARVTVAIETKRIRTEIHRSIHPLLRRITRVHQRCTSHGDVWQSRWRIAGTYLSIKRSPQGVMTSRRKRGHPQSPLPNRINPRTHECTQECWNEVSTIYKRPSEQTIRQRLSPWDGIRHVFRSIRDFHLEQRRRRTSSLYHARNINLGPHRTKAS